MGTTGGELRDLLAESEVFRGCTTAVLDGLCDGAAIRELADGQKLWDWGSSARELVVVLSGCLEVVRGGDGVPAIAFRRLEIGEILGYSALVGEAHSADVRASGTTTVAALPVAIVENVIADEPRVALRMIGALGHLVSCLSDELGELRTLDLEARLLRWLWRNAGEDGEVSITHRQLAEFVGATRANVSRALKNLALAGHVRLSRGVVHLLRLSQ